MDAGVPGGPPGKRGGGRRPEPASWRHRHGSGRWRPAAAAGDVRHPRDPDQQHALAVAPPLRPTAAVDLRRELVLGGVLQVHRQVARQRRACADSAASAAAVSWAMRLMRRSCAWALRRSAAAAGVWPALGRGLCCAEQLINLHGGALGDLLRGWHCAASWPPARRMLHWLLSLVSSSKGWHFAIPSCAGLTALRSDGVHAGKAMAGFQSGPVIASPQGCRPNKCWTCCCPYCPPQGLASTVFSSPGMAVPRSDGACAEGQRRR